jgi:hypothetical protein
MGIPERRERMSRMRAIVRSANIYTWAANIVEAIADFRPAAHRPALQDRAAMEQVA